MTCYLSCLSQSSVLYCTVHYCTVFNYMNYSFKHNIKVGLCCLLLSTLLSFIHIFYITIQDIKHSVNYSSRTIFKISFRSYRTRAFEFNDSHVLFSQSTQTHKDKIKNKEYQKTFQEKKRLEKKIKNVEEKKKTCQEGESTGNFINKKEKMVTKIRNRKNLQSRKLVAKNKALEKLVKNWK